jgi:hypothetical protein
MAVAQNRISLRKAANLTYLGQVMLSSIPLVKQEFPFEYKFNQWREALANAAPLSRPPSLTDSSSECLRELPETDSAEDALVLETVRLKCRCLTPTSGGVNFVDRKLGLQSNLTLRNRDWRLNEVQ